MAPKQVEFPQESHAGKRKGIGQREGLSPGKRFQTVLTTSQATLQDEIKVCQWWKESYYTMISMVGGITLCSDVNDGRNHTTQ